MSRKNAQTKDNLHGGSSTSRSCTRWEQKEDQALINAMIELIEIGGWKGDNGQFRYGAYTKLEKIMEEKLPGCRMKAKPHIESRVKLLRNQYNAIAEMLGPNASGFGWNDKEKFVTCPKEVWEEWIKSHKNAIGLRNKPFPFYDELDQIFGKDRATGEDAEGVEDAQEEIEKEDENSPIVDLEENDNNFTQLINEENLVQPSSSTMPSGRKVKKAKISNMEILQEFSTRMQKMGEMMEVASGNIGRLANCFQHESDSVDRRMQVTTEVMKIPGLADFEVLAVSKKIALNPLEVDFFFSFPEDYRRTYVQSLLIGD